MAQGSVQQHVWLAYALPARLGGVRQRKWRLEGTSQAR